MPSHTRVLRRPLLALRALALSWLVLLAGWLLSTEVHAQTTSPEIAQDLRRMPDQGAVPSELGTVNPTNRRETNVTGEP